MPSNYVWNAGGTSLGKKTSVPRHADIDEYTAFDICKQLGIPKPKIN